MMKDVDDEDADVDVRDYDDQDEDEEGGEGKDILIGEQRRAELQIHRAPSRA